MPFLRDSTKALVFYLAAYASSAQALPEARQDASASKATSYDFIVVGGGTAGNAVAARLSQYLPSCSVLVIEAGPFAPDEDRINVPGMKGSTLGTIYDWNFTSIPQAALDNRIITQSRGKVLGGSSALNLLIWDRGSKPEYDAWGEVNGNDWNWDTMIAAMNKAENFSNPGPPIYTGHTDYGVTGPIHAVVDRYRPAQQRPWVPTFANLDVYHNTDWLAGENTGAAFHSSAIEPSNYTRSYSAVTYLPQGGPNLKVVTNTQVAHVNLEKKGSSHTVTGVTLLNGTVINAKKEVILSGGTISNPQLLELSGIGQPKILKAAGVKQIIKLPGVGENLQDHPRIQASYQLKDNFTSFDKLKINTTYAAQQLALWEAGSYSAYDYAASAYSYQNWTSIYGSEDNELIDAAKRVVASKENNVVDKVKLGFLTNSTVSPGIAQVELVFSDGYTGGKGYPKAGTPLYGKGFSTIIAGLMHPLARGNVHINTSDATQHPVYDPTFASNEYDLKALVTMAKYIRKVFQTPPFSDSFVSEYEPGTDVVQTDAEWLAYVRNNTNTFYHPVGTCAMLPENEGGVVDGNLTVYGTSNLRIVDASVIPILVSAHPQTGIYGIAERAAEIIADHWS